MEDWLKREDCPWLSPLFKVLPTAQATLSASGDLGRRDGENLPPYRSIQLRGGASRWSLRSRSGGAFGRSSPHWFPRRSNVAAASPELRGAATLSRRSRNQIGDLRRTPPSTVRAILDD